MESAKCFGGDFTEDKQVYNRILHLPFDPAETIEFVIEFYHDVGAIRVWRLSRKPTAARELVAAVGMDDGARLPHLPFDAKLNESCTIPCDRDTNVALLIVGVNPTMVRISAMRIGGMVSIIREFYRVDAIEFAINGFGQGDFMSHWSDAMNYVNDGLQEEAQEMPPIAKEPPPEVTELLTGCPEIAPEIAQARRASIPADEVLAANWTANFFYEPEQAELLYSAELHQMLTAVFVTLTAWRNWRRRSVLQRVAGHKQGLMTNALQDALENLDDKAHAFDCQRWSQAFLQHCGENAIGE